MMHSPRSGTPDILPVPRSSRDARRYYDRLSRVYDCFTAAYERKLADRCLDRLSIQEGEEVLEIGFGSGLSCFCGTITDDLRTSFLTMSSLTSFSTKAAEARSSLLPKKR